MNTKELILEKSLTLFAEKGYSDVYVNEIAAAVGIKAPSLYKHYKNKQEIFDSCIKVFYDRMQQMTGAIAILGKDVEDINVNEIKYEDFFEITSKIFLFHLKDEIASKLRKMLSIERYSNENLNSIYEELFLNEPIRYETGLFKGLLVAGILNESDPRVLAYRYYTPMFFLLTKYDMHLLEEEEALKELEILTKDFWDCYKKEK